MAWSDNDAKTQQTINGESQQSSRIHALCATNENLENPAKIHEKNRISTNLGSNHREA